MRVNAGTSKGRGPSPVLLVAAGLIAVVGMVLAYQVFLTMLIKVDGAEIRVASTTTVSDLLDQRRLRGKPGDLIAVKTHKVLQAGKGEMPGADVNGRQAKPDARLFAGDEVTSRDGSDTVEPLAKRTESYSLPVKYEGKGPIETVVREAKDGQREVTFGSVSKEIVAYRVVTAAQAMLIARNQPKPGQKIVALTFDDGPWPGSTRAILGILKKYKIRATFFMIGRQAKHSPSLAREVAGAGMLVANHSETHPYPFDKQSPSGVTWQIQQAQKDIAAVTGQTPKFFRPPGGAVNRGMWSVLKADGMKSVLWDVDPKDWQKPPTAKIIERVVGRVRPGDVVLMHDGGGDRSHTVQALPQIIERLRANGYTFVTLDALTSLPGKMG